MSAVIVRERLRPYAEAIEAIASDATCLMEVSAYGLQAYALIDRDDAALVLPYRWRCAPNNGIPYVKARTRDGRTLYLHRLILQVDDPLLTVDHVSTNALDNRRCNLRLATRGQQQRNQRAIQASSAYKGVSWDARCKRWCAQIRADGRATWLGRFCSEKDAARAYDAAARDLHGEFARLNFPRPGEQLALRGAARIATAQGK
jgi:hypothetical protein